MPALVASLILAAALALGGCSDDENACEQILNACHDVDPGEGPIHDCHENSEEEWSESECGDNLDSCLSLCEAAESDADAGID